MSAGFFALLDDVAVLARMAAASIDDVGAAAAKASAKAAGVVVDDTAVTPQYVAGVAAERELPIIKKIAIGSLRNKLLFILPAALLLSQFLSGCSRRCSCAAAPTSATRAPRRSGSGSAARTTARAATTRATR